MWTCFVSWNASSPSWPSSRPRPDCLKPPNGPASLSVRGSLNHTVPDPQGARMVDEGGEELVVDRVLDVEPLRGRAHLPRVEVRRPGAAARRHLDLAGDVGADDERVLATQLEVDPRDPVHAHVRDP